MIKAWRWVGRYMHHPDPPAAAMNRVAMVIGWNTPLYPLYLLAMPGTGLFPAGWLTLSATPLFLAVPAVMRRSALAGRLLMPAVGAANSVFGVWVMGPASGTTLFLLPCAILAALLHRPAELHWRLAVLAFVAAAYLLCVSDVLHPLTKLAPETSAAIFRLNGFSLVCLMAFLALVFAPLMEPGPAKR